MKHLTTKLLIGALCTAVCWSLASCNNTPQTAAAQATTLTDGHNHNHDGHECDGHDHDHEHDHDHNHDGHHHDHDGHNHSHDGHGHSHDGHSHDAHAEEGNPDEIILSAEKAREAGVEVETVKPGTFVSVLEVSGRIAPSPLSEAAVTANMSGIVHFVKPLTEGSLVRKGDVLFTITSKNLQDGDPAQRARIEYENARIEYERAAALVNEKIVSQQEYQAAKSRYETARLTYEALASDQSLEGAAVKALADGYIESCQIKEGDYVSVGTRMANIVTDGPLYLRADVAERHFPQLSSVKAANFSLAYDNQTTYSTSRLNGRLLAYGKSSDESNGYIPVTFQIDRAKGILPGAFARIWLLSEEKQGVISLPVTAITEEQGLNFVYLRLDATCYTKRNVTLGACDGYRYEILSGLQGGEEVVTKGAIQVKLASASNAIPAHSHSH